MSDLRNRARQSNDGGGVDDGGRTALAVRRQEVADKLDLMLPQFQLALPRGIEARQIIRDAMTLVSQTPALLSVDQNTFMGALMTCSQLGLRPGVLGQAYVLPFRGKAQFVAGYKGLATLAHRSGQIAGITNEIIRARDTWSLERGTEERLSHKPGFGRPDDRAELEPVAYYAIVRTINGGRYLHFMERWEVEDHRDRFALQRDRQTGRIKGPWVEHFDAMALKTTLKYALRVAPMTLELQQAVRADETVRYELDPVKPVEEQVIETSVFDAEVDDDDDVEAQVRAADPT